MSAISDMISEPRFWVLLVFVSAFGLILSEKIHRTIAAWFGCVCVMFLGISMGVKDHEGSSGVFNLCKEVGGGETNFGHLIASFMQGSQGLVCKDSLESLMLSWIHFDVIGLLLGMMIREFIVVGLIILASYGMMDHIIHLGMLIMEGQVILHLFLLLPIISHQ